MKFLICGNGKSNLVYDDVYSLIRWEEIKPKQEADRLVLQKIYNDFLQNNIIVPEDLELLLISAAQDISVFEGLLKIDGEIIGVINLDIKKSEFNSLKKNGGLIILIHDKKEVVKIIPSYPNSLNTSDWRLENNIISNNRKNIESDYIEATIKLPRNIIDSNDSETIKRILDSNIQMYRQLNSLNSRIDRLSEDMYSKKQNEDLFMAYKNRIENLTVEIDMLRKERVYLEKEISIAESTALNTLKSNLKHSKAAIERHIDLKEFPATKSRIIDIIINLFKDVYSPKEIEDLLMKEDRVKELEDFSDNVDAKIQSLNEIKSEFISQKIIKSSKGEV
ncbi:hypothetical protein WB980_004972 [Bacillus cereus]